MKFTVGADPEIFLQDKDGNTRSAIDTFGGTKSHPMPLPIGEGFFVQEDNVALEFNIPPSESSEALLNNIKSVTSFLALRASEEFGFLFSSASALVFPDDELADPRAFAFGCEPDFNAWTGKTNRKPKASNPNLRSAGGHIHVGLDIGESKKDKMRLARLMDLHLGVPSILMDTGEERKQLYGKAGAMRFKPFGIEYRVLSNFWVFNPMYTKWAWDAVDRAVNDFAYGKDVLHLEDIICETINNNVKGKAAQMVSDFDLCYA